jgi:hypothetical protein
VSFDDYETTESHERRITRCSSCRARIIFLPTKAGKQMPIDADTVEPGDEEFLRHRHQSHFSNCPGATTHRRPR